MRHYRYSSAMFPFRMLSRILGIFIVPLAPSTINAPRTFQQIRTPANADNYPHRLDFYRVACIFRSANSPTHATALFTCCRCPPRRPEIFSPSNGLAPPMTSLQFSSHCFTELSSRGTRGVPGTCANCESSPSRHNTI